MRVQWEASSRAEKIEKVHKKYSIAFYREKMGASRQGDRKIENNLGMTLIEVIISVLIIAIAMGPVFIGFLRSQRMNKKYDEKRNVEVMTQALLESTKAVNIQTLKEQFKKGNSDLALFDLFPLKDGTKELATDVVRLSPVNHIELPTASFLSDDPDGIYVFGIDGLLIDYHKYDVRMTLDACRSRGKVDYQSYNQFESPHLTSLESNQVGLIQLDQKIFGTSCDELAINEFMNRHERFRQDQITRKASMEQAYQAQVNEANRIGGAIPEEPTYPEIPVSYTEDEIFDNVRKQCNIYVTSIGGKYQLKAEVTYRCQFSLPIRYESSEAMYQDTDQVVVEQIYSQEFTTPVKYLYLFYTESKCNESNENITFHNEAVSEEGDPLELNIYVVKQKTASMGVLPRHRLELVKDNASIGGVNLYTNMEYNAGTCELQIRPADYKEIGEVKKDQSVDTLMNVKIEVFEYQPIRADKYQSVDLVYSIISSDKE